MTRNELSCPCSLLLRSLFFGFYLMSAAMPVSFPIFPILIPLQPSDPEFLMLEASEQTCVPNCNDAVNLFFLQRCDFRDTCAAPSFGTSNFPRAVFFVVWFNEEYSSQLCCIVELWFLDSPSLCCFAFRCIKRVLPTYLAIHCRVLKWCFLVCLSPDHVYPSCGLSFSRTNLANLVHASDNSLSPSTFQ